MPARFKWMNGIKPGKPDYIAMREEIREALIAQDLSPTTLAKELGLDRFYLINYLEGKKKVMEAEKAALIRRRIGLSGDPTESRSKSPRRKEVSDMGQASKGVRFGGYEGAGAWREPGSYGMRTNIPADPSFPEEHQAVFEVAGESHLRGARNGDMLLSLVKHFTVTDGANVLVRKKLGALEQICVHSARVYSDRTELWPATYAFDDETEPLIRDTECCGGGCDVIGIVLKVLNKREG